LPKCLAIAVRAFTGGGEICWRESVWSSASYGVFGELAVRWGIRAQDNPGPYNEIPRHRQFLVAHGSGEPGELCWQKVPSRLGRK
jgi:hypothetical protein